MRPRTGKQFRIWELYQAREAVGLNRLTVQEKKWIEGNAYKGKFCSISNLHDRCCQCGKMVGKGVKVCPHCGNRRESTYRCRARNLYEYAGMAMTCGEWQIVRIVEVARAIRRDGVRTGMCVVAENWIDGKGHREVIARNRVMSGCSFNWWSKMSLKNKGKFWYGGYNDKAEYLDYSILMPGGRLTRFYRSRGVSLRQGIRDDLARVCCAVPDDNMLETLLKVGLVRLALGRIRGMCFGDQFLKIALRYRYDPVDARMWSDYVDQLVYMGKDAHNPKILLPENLGEAHQKMTEMVNRRKRKEEEIRAAERRKRDVAEARRNEDRYRKEKERFLGIRFSGDGIDFHVLQSPLEFLEEGEAMHHCVAGYWSHDNSLVLSARDERGKRLETVEVNLRTFSIVQSQGPCNRPTEWHESIMETVNRNMKLIKSA